MSGIRETSTFHLSIVVPVYRSDESLRELCSRLERSLTPISASYEIVLVNDASPDQAWDIIQELATNDVRIRGINLSRNFGQHNAITAGLDFVRGDWIVVMDCDLQDMPEEIPKLYRKAKEGYDIVVGLRVERKDSFLKKLGSKLFKIVFNYFTESDLDNRAGNFGIYSRKVIVNVSRLREQNRSFGLFALWVGFRRTGIEIKHAPRMHGKSSYTLSRLIALAMDSIIAHSNKLLRLSIKLGFVLSFTSLLYAIYLVLNYIIWASPAEGWTSLIVSIYFTSGLIIGNIGVVGLYVGKIFNEVKGRPLYVIHSTTFELDNNDE